VDIVDHPVALIASQSSAHFCHRAFMLRVLDCTSNSNAMSDFVNYNKRDVSLPPGCKDLADVFTNDLSGANDCGQTQVGTVMDIFNRLHHLKGDVVYLHLVSPVGRFAVTICLVRGNARKLSDGAIFTVHLPHNESGEDRLRKYLAKRGLKLDDNPLPHTSGFRNWQLRPVPENALGLVLFAAELFRDFCCLDDSSNLQFELGQL
jgi:hypothetical protein